MQTQQTEPKRIRRYIVHPDRVEVQYIVEGEIVLAHTIYAESGVGGWGTLYHNFGLRIGKHIAPHKDGRMIEVINAIDGTRFAALHKRIAFRVWRLDVPEN